MKIKIQTFGCRANQYDSGGLADQFRGQGHQLVDSVDDAELCVINTCAITDKADREARRLAGQINRRNPAAKIIVTGCTAEVEPEKFSGLKNVSVVAEKGAIVTPLENDKTPVYFQGGVRLEGHSRSFLKIQDGCSQFCSFCIVPFARGLNRSIAPARIMASLAELHRQKIAEVVLTGIHLGTYGRDLEPRWSLLDLLKLMEANSPVRRLRLSSIDPEEVDTAMITFLRNSKVFCPHLHLPLQSGDDEVLKKMRRRYRSRYFSDLVCELVRTIPDLCVGTDVIVGFPGESEAAFQNTLRLIADLPLAYLHVFPYSPRRGTKAAAFADQIDEKTKKQRAKILRQISVRKRQAFHQRFIEREFDAILEKGQAGPRALTGNYISVEVSGMGDYERGQLVRTKIQTIYQQSIYGSVIGSSMGA